MDNKIPYRADIDGLRAIAVTLVVLYHFGLGVSSGFIGVDVFFVISGYLIGSKILPEINEGSFSFKSFWLKRIKRLLPAALVMVITTLVVGWFVMLPGDYKHLGQSSLAHLLFSSNIFFWKNIHYFTESVSSFPLLHTWSLSVEEQFYLLLPLLLYVATKLGRNVLRIIVVLSLILSALLCLYASRHYQTPNYYLLPTRWWELGIGLLFPLFSIEKKLNKRGGALLLILGLSMILLSAFITPTSNFPSEWTLLPVIGTMFCIAGGKSNSRTKSVISLRPVVFIGLISYSLYLWHWPIHSFLSYLELGGFDYHYGYRFLGVGLSFVIAVISWKFVEKRYRYQTISTKNSIYEFSFVLCIVLVISSFCFLTNGFVNRLSSVSNKFLLSKPPNKGILIEGIIPERDKRYHQIGVNSKNSIKICLWGDSHAAPYLPLFRKIGNTGEVSGFAALCASTPPLLNYIPSHFYSLKEKAPMYNSEILKKIFKDEIEVVFLGAVWNDHFKYVRETAEESLKETIRVLEEAGVKVVVITQAPRSEGNSPKMMAFREWQNIEAPTLIPSVQYLSGVQFDVFRNLKIEKQVVGVSDSLLTKDGSYRRSFDGFSCYYDDQHLSKWGGKLLEEPLLLTLKEFRSK